MDHRVRVMVGLITATANADAQLMTTIACRQILHLAQSLHTGSMPQRVSPPHRVGLLASGHGLNIEMSLHGFAHGIGEHVYGQRERVHKGTDNSHRTERPLDDNVAERIAGRSNGDVLFVETTALHLHFPGKVYVGIDRLARDDGHGFIHPSVDSDFRGRARDEGGTRRHHCHQAHGHQEMDGNIVSLRLFVFHTKKVLPYKTPFCRKDCIILPQFTFY